jgi:broad specificity phosphatase PhoE
MSDDSHPSTTIYLLRHGATAANLMKPYILQGRGINKGLAEVGIQQAQAARDFLKSTRLDAAYCSPMVRACETANIICQPHQLSPLVLHELIEGDVGDWEGLSWDIIHRDHAENCQKYLAQPGTCPYPNGESYVDVVERVLPALSKISERHAGQNLLVVAHNIVNRALLATIMRMNINDAKDLKQSNCGINVLKVKNGKFEVLTVNAAFHLDTITPATSVIG